MTVFKVFVYLMAGLGVFFLSCAFAVLVGKVIAYGNRRPAPKVTVVWRDTDVMLQAFTGTIEPVGDHHIRITDDAGWSEMVDIHDVEECY